MTFTLDQINPFTKNPVNKYSPFSEALPYVSASYLHERRHKRELRLESAPGRNRHQPFPTGDQERNLIFNLRSAFIQTCVRFAISRRRIWLIISRTGHRRGSFKAGHRAGDLDRLELQRVQYESDLQTAT